jgi:hypothetical protein
MSNSPMGTESSPQFAAITPSDTLLLKYNGEIKKCRAIYIGDISGGATLTCKNDVGASIAFAGLVAGSVIPVSTDCVTNTGTLASSLIALY